MKKQDLENFNLEEINSIESSAINGGVGVLLWIVGAICVGVAVDVLLNPKSSTKAIAEGYNNYKSHFSDFN